MTQTSTEAAIKAILGKSALLKCIQCGVGPNDEIALLSRTTFPEAVQAPEMQLFQKELMEACVGVLSAVVRRLVDHKGTQKVTLGYYILLCCLCWHPHNELLLC